MGRGGARPRKRTRGPHLIRRKGVWYAYLARGHAVSLGTTDEAQARERFRRVLAENAVERSPRDRTVTVEKVTTEYLTAPHAWTPRTLHSTRCRIAAWAVAMAELGAIQSTQVTPATLDAWRVARMADVSRATVARDEAAVGRCWRWAMRRGLVTTDPFQHRAPVKEPRRPRPRTIHSPAQVGRMVAWALGEADAHQGGKPKARRHAASLLGWALTAAALEATGFRIDEARRMTVAWVTANGVRLVPEAGAADMAWTSKGYKPREVSLSDASRDVLRRFIAWRDSPHGRAQRSGVSERWFATVADKAAAACEFPPTYRPHDSRRRWVTELHRAGTPLKAISQLVGHADVQTTERYVCGYYDDPAMVTASTPVAVEALTRAPAGVIAITSRKR